MAYSKQDIRQIIKRAPFIADEKPLREGDSLPDHHLTAHTLEDYHILGRTFMAAIRKNNPLNARMLADTIAHEGQHGHAIEQLGGVAVYTLAVYRREGSVFGREYPYRPTTRADGLEHGSPEFTVGTAYPEDLSHGDRAYLNNRNLTVADVDEIALKHGWNNLRPLSLRRPTNSF